MLNPTVSRIRQEFINGFSRCIQDSHPNGMLEIIGASFIADEPSIFGTINPSYQTAELDWYNTQSLKLSTLDEIYGKIPEQWQRVSNSEGEINSNYGYLAYNKYNGSQYDNVLRELKNNIWSRRAIMIYTNPHMHSEYREDGKDDFVCTNTVSYHYDRKLGLCACVQMRSNDAIYGYPNDLYWQQTVLNRLSADLELKPGPIVWQAQSLHIYPRHLHYVSQAYINS